MKKRLTESRLANLGARAIHGAFDGYQLQFREITRRARARFEACDWRGMQSDASERLDLYKQTVDPVVAHIRELLGEQIHAKLVWASMKAVYSGLIAGREDWELAETYFNSVTRRIFSTVGVDPQIEFVNTDFDLPPTRAAHPVYRTYERADSIDRLVETILADYRFQASYADAARDSRLVAAEIRTRLRALGALRVVERAELIKPVFYRNTRAYLVGRLYSGTHMIPLVLALVHAPEGVVVDAVLLDEDDVSIVFSFARSYFHVDVERPYDLIQFLKDIMPRKRRAELYIAIGQHKHGKTELYRGLLEHLATSDGQFEIAAGERGMVMAVFTLRSYDLVLKVIKDRFAEPKNTTRQRVMAKYHLVFKHDRAGRLVDAQEFEHLQFDCRRFSPSLLQELQRVASQTVSLEGEKVVINHAYVERRVIPMDLFVREAEEAAARAVVVDYGQAIKDLAATNIFPGDLLLKNFGVTRHGRVVFYDYDELCFLTDCIFSPMPQPRDEQEELADEPWFYVADNQVFPEEFRTFLGMRAELREVFTQHHADLFEAEFWQRLQARHTAGEVIDILPYDESKRLTARPGAPPESFA